MEETRSPLFGNVSFRDFRDEKKRFFFPLFSIFPPPLAATIIRDPLENTIFLVFNLEQSEDFFSIIFITDKIVYYV